MKYKNKKITENDPLCNKRLISGWCLRAYINGSVTSQSNRRDKNKQPPRYDTEFSQHSMCSKFI